jgi:hypothetical protein
VDGSTREVPVGEALMCAASVPYRHRFDTDGSDVVGFGDQRSRHFVRPCTAQGRRTTKSVGATGLLTAGLDAGDDLRVVLQRGVVEAYRLS